MRVEVAVAECNLVIFNGKDNNLIYIDGCSQKTKS